MFEMNSTLIKAQSRNVPLSTYGSTGKCLLQTFTRSFAKHSRNTCFRLHVDLYVPPRGFFWPCTTVVCCVRVWSGPNV